MKIDREALPFALILAGASVAGWFLHPLVAAPGVLLVLFTLWFFRDPARRTPHAPDTLFSPADGKIIRTGPDRISVFMNVFDVHVCRAPAAGELTAVEHREGRFLAAFKDHASEENERVRFVLADGETTIRFTLIAGLVARRIVPRVRAGERLAAGQRVGLIRFGSRVDVELAPGFGATVALGQRVVAGESPIARRSPGTPAQRG